MALLLENNDLEYYDCLITDDIDDNDLDEYENYEEIIKKKFLNKHYLKNNFFTSYIVDKEFLEYCCKWSLNRDIDHLHVKTLYDEFKIKINESSELDLPNTISISYYENKYFIIDGQHRIKAIKELTKNYEFDCKLRVDLYYPKNYEDMLNILSVINYSKPLDINSIFNTIINDILTFIKTEYKNINKNIIKASNKCQRPFINEYQFVEKLKECKFIISYKKTTFIFKKIRKINERYQNLDPKKLKFNNKSLTSNMILKAGEFNCFLGFDTDFEWLYEINSELENKFKS